MPECLRVTLSKFVLATKLHNALPRNEHALNKKGGQDFTKNTFAVIPTQEFTAEIHVIANTCKKTGVSLCDMLQEIQYFCLCRVI